MRPHFLFATLALAACSPVEPPAAAVTPAPSPVQQESPSAPPQASKPVAKPDAGPLISPRLVETSVSGIPVKAVVFDARSHHLRVADQAGGPDSQWPDARAAGQAMGGLAAVNGGFFTPEGQPLGQLVAAGRKTGTVNRASSLGGGWYVDDGRGLDLVRREQFRGGREALQTGPFLVENGRPVSGLSTRSSSARTFLASDGRHGWIMATTGACSLEELAKALAGTNIGGIPLRSALNLDGGRSSEIWIAGTLAGGPRHDRPFWNKPVRNFLVLTPRGE
ncbi:phosphodiester glycosidase family protein [Luteolibacter marinus]|uniref:phosphodiester glycosidase family protein n=1 Tax=Luteolibacter marinus TaxID=2776705 RepID=UPI001866A7B8|nr:phosphodiester glycosidase family protein [Luteolibacter marinus]